MSKRSTAPADDPNSVSDGMHLFRQAQYPTDDLERALDRLVAKARGELPCDPISVLDAREAIRSLFAEREEWMTDNLNLHRASNEQLEERIAELERDNDLARKALGEVDSDIEKLEREQDEAVYFAKHYCPDIELANRPTWDTVREMLEELRQWCAENRRAPIGEYCRKMSGIIEHRRGDGD